MVVGYVGDESGSSRMCDLPCPTYLAIMDRTEQIFAAGTSPSGDAWSLGWDGDEHEGVTWLRVTTPDGHTHKGGYGSPSISSKSPVSMYSGSADNVPKGAILRVASGVTALEATTSDGITQTLELVEHPVHKGALVAAVVYPQGTSVTSVSVVDRAGHRELPITQAQV